MTAAEIIEDAPGESRAQSRPPRRQRGRGRWTELAL